MKPLPTAPGERIETLDVVRGFALLGILPINIVAMAFPFGAYFNPAAMGPPSQADLTAWFITNTFVEGSMRTLFSMLFGAGFILFLERQEANGAGLIGAKLYVRRAVILILLGIVDQVLFLWNGDILFTYGAAALFLPLFWKSKMRTLVITALALFAVIAAINVTNAERIAGLRPARDAAVALRDAGQTLTREQNVAISTWDGETSVFSPTRPEIEQTTARTREGWVAVAAHNAQGLLGQPIGVWVTVFLLDAVAAMVLGMIAYRLGLLQGRWSLRAILALTLFCFGIGIPINLMETRAIMDSSYSPVAFYQQMRTYDMGRVLLAGGWLGLILLICKAPFLGWVRASVGAVGRMALTNYLAHSILAAIVFVGLGNFAKLSRSELYVVVLAFWAFDIVFSMAWLSVFRMGPFEWIWRAATYGHWPPLWRQRRSERVATA